MKIINRGITKTGDLVTVELTIEKSFDGHYNSYHPTVELYTMETIGLTDDQIVTKAWHKEKDTIMLGFKRVIDALGLIDTDVEDVYENFEFSPIIITEPTSDPLANLQPSLKEIEKAEFELNTITLLLELGVIQS